MSQLNPTLTRAVLDGLVTQAEAATIASSLPDEPTVAQVLAALAMNCDQPPARADALGGFLADGGMGNVRRAYDAELDRHELGRAEEARTWFDLAAGKSVPADQD